jgi:hypothetical protein
LGDIVLKELTTDIERFVTKLTYIESERDQILEETLVFIASADKRLSHSEIIKLAKQKAFEIADKLIEKNLMS